MNVRERHCKNNIRKDRHIVSPHIGRRAKLGKRNCQQGYELRKGPVWKQHQTDFKNEEGVGGAFQKKREKGGELKAKPTKVGGAIERSRKVKLRRNSQCDTYAVDDGVHQALRCSARYIAC